MDVCADYRINQRGEVMSEKQLYKFALSTLNSENGYRVYLVGELPNAWVRFWMFVVFGGRWVKHEQTAESSSVTTTTRGDLLAMRDEIKNYVAQEIAKLSNSSNTQPKREHESETQSDEANEDRHEDRRPATGNRKREG